MQAILLFTVLAIWLTLAKATKVSHATDAILMNFLMRNRAVCQEHPKRSMDCFDYYLPLMSDISDEYERSYNGCVQQAECATSRLEDTVATEREEIAKFARNTCDMLDSCVTMTDVIWYFECFAEVGAKASQDMYLMSLYAEDVLDQTREQYQLIKLEQQRCTSKATDAYVQNYTSTYEQLQSCLLGETPIPAQAAAASNDEAARSKEPIEDDTEDDVAIDDFAYRLIIRALKKHWIKF